jgi:DNA-binding response OmpR family regulator
VARVLIVEDDDDLRSAIGVSPRSAGIAVDTAADLPDADLALASTTYDSVVFDQTLPSGDALDYVRARRSAGWRVPVLFLTSRATVADRIAALQHADDYLAKPFAMAELLERVQSLTRRAVHQLTAAQQLLLDHHPQLLTSPHDILATLHPDADGTTAASVTPAIPPTETQDNMQNKQLPFLLTRNSNLS